MARFGIPRVTRASLAVLGTRDGGLGVCNSFRQVASQTLSRAELTSRREPPAVKCAGCFIPSCLTGAISSRVLSGCILLFIESPTAAPGRLAWECPVQQATSHSSKIGIGSALRGERGCLLRPFAYYRRAAFWGLPPMPSAACMRVPCADPVSLSCVHSSGWMDAVDIAGTPDC